MTWPAMCSGFCSYYSPPMAALQPPARRRRRPRRGSLERPVNARLYRASFLVVVVPAGAAPRHGDQSRWRSRRPTLPPAFDASVAAGLARELATEYPDRSPGSPGALAAANWFRQKMSVFDLPTRATSWRESIPGLGRPTPPERHGRRARASRPT